MLNCRYNAPIVNDNLEKDFMHTYDRFVKSYAEVSDYQCFHIDLDEVGNEVGRLRPHVQCLDKFTNIIIIGMGGAINNPRAVLEVLNKSKKTVHYFDTTDSYYYNALIAKIHLKDAAVIVISKSGDTLETVALTLSLIEEFKKQNIPQFHNQFLFITQEHPNIVNGIAKDLGSNILTHQNIGGRFATFTNIIFLPMLLCGLDPIEFCLGGKEVVSDLWDKKHNSKAAQGVAFFLESFVGRPVHINISYLACLKTVFEWYDQVFAESLGKDKFSITPISVLAPQNQHSHLQLYLEGMQNKSYTVYTIEHQVDVPAIKMPEVGLIDLGKICAKQSRALIELLTIKGNPCREISLVDLKPENLGALMMLQMLEVVLYGMHIAINPFGQPAVEEMKKMVKSALE